jgi:hypothetical protein
MACPSAALRTLFLVLTGGALAIAQSANPEAWVGHRYDDAHVLFYFTESTNKVSDPARGPALSLPVARYGGDGGSLYSLPPGRFAKMTLKPDLRLPLGRRFEVLLGGAAAAQVEIEGLVEQETCSDNFIGAIARVVSNLDRYRTSRAKYYVVRAAASALPATRSAILAARPQLDAKQLSANLNQRMAIELPRVQRRSADSTPRGRRVAARWRPLDERLARGQAVLAYDVQAVRIAGNLRYYVKARWALRGTVLFLMTAWLRPDLSVEAADSSDSQLLRLAEMQGARMDFANLPQLLNVFDDGSLLLTGEGYEGFGISLFTYTPEGPKETPVSYAYGC